MATYLVKHYQRKIKIFHYESFNYKINIRLFKLYYVTQSSTQLSKLEVFLINCSVTYNILHSYVQVSRLIKVRVRSNVICCIIL